jgi:hypothetical protein
MRSKKFGICSLRKRGIKLTGKNIRLRGWEVSSGMTLLLSLILLRCYNSSLESFSKMSRPILHLILTMRDMSDILEENNIITRKEETTTITKVVIIRDKVAAA